MNPTNDTSYALVGLKHVGKSTLGIRLARELGYRFCDLDDEMLGYAVAQGVVSPSSTVRQLFQAVGPTVFGDVEYRALQALIAAGLNSTVLSAGGGVADHENLLRLIQERFTVVYLHNDPLVLYERIMKRGTPAFLDPTRPRDHFLEIAQRRSDRYRDIADISVDVTDLDSQRAFQKLFSRVR